MLTREDDVDAHKLHKKGWTISAIARHLGHDRKTIRAYLTGERVAGERARSSDDPFDKFVDYVCARLVEDPHLWATTLCDELETLGIEVAYTLTREQPPDWQGYARRIDDELLREVAFPAAERPRVYVCGSTHFVDAAADGLVRLGYDPLWIRTERFGATG